MDPQVITLLREACDFLDKINENLERIIEKEQEVLERIECIDNTLDDMKENSSEFEVGALARLDTIIKQGRP